MGNLIDEFKQNAAKRLVKQFLPMIEENLSQIDPSIDELLSKTELTEEQYATVIIWKHSSGIYNASIAILNKADNSIVKLTETKPVKDVILSIINPLK